MNSDRIVLAVLDGDIRSFDTTTGNIFAPNRGIFEIDRQTGSFSRREASALAAAGYNLGLNIDEARIDRDESVEESVKLPRRGTIPKHEVRKAVQRLTPSLRKCYEIALKRNVKLEIAIEVRLRVNKDGDISRLRIAGLNDEAPLKSCVESVIEETSFPEPVGGPVELILPFLMSPSN